MAVEGPGLNDGTLIAAANYSKTASLAGANGSGQYLGLAISQAAAQTGVVASTKGQQIKGVLSNAPALGQACDVRYLGASKAMCGTGGSTQGKPQMVLSNGTFTDWVAGSGWFQVGVARETAVAGQIFMMDVGGLGAGALT